MKYRVRITKQPSYQYGGGQEAQASGQDQIMQVIQAYAQATGSSPEEIMQQLKQMQPEEQKQTLMQMVQQLQGGSQGEQGEMAYGGQMGYGLDLGARRLWMNQSGDDDVDVNKSITAVPREEANIEAEGGETALIPEQDQTYSHYNIKGKRHTEGGVPLNVPEGTFIYSDTKKMRLGGPVLSMFGKSEKSTKKYTPADLAKQYDVNKYKAILEDPRADKIKKRTAELMIQNYQKKLAQLALVQEGKKGFPQGIPQVAQGYYQQMMQAQQGGEQEMQQEAPQQPQAMYGMGFRYGGALKRYQGDVYGSEVDDEQERPVFKPKTQPVETPSLDPATGIYDPRSAAVEENYGKSMEDANDYTDLKSETNPYDEKQIPYGWTTPDKMNLMNSLANLASIRKFTPFEPTVKIPTIDATYVDPSRALAANAEQMNAARQAAAMFAGPAARYSFNAGQYGKNAADVISQYANQNVGIGNTAAAQNAQIATQQAQYDAQRLKRLYDAGVIGEQDYINAMRQGTKGVIQSYAQGEGNAASLYNMNMTESPYYYMDPRNQKIKFLQGRKMYFDSKDPFSQYSSNVEKLSQIAQALREKDQSLTAAEAHNIAMQMMGYGSSKTVKNPRPKGNTGK